jgi:hypothetical protein
MKYHITVAIVFLVVNFSCKSDDSLNSVDSSTLSTKAKTAFVLNSKADDQFKNIYFPSMRLFNGQTLIIQYISAGCFGHQNEIVRIKRVKGNYLLTCSKILDNQEVRIISDSTMDSSFISTLNAFSAYCKRNILKNIKDTTDKGIIYSTNSQSLSINDGLHVIDIPLKDIDTYYSLIAHFVKLKLFTTKVEVS